MILLPRADWLARTFKTKKALVVSKVSLAEALEHYFGELDEYTQLLFVNKKLTLAFQSLVRHTFQLRLTPPPPTKSLCSVSD